MSRSGSKYLRLLQTMRWRRLRAWKLGESPFCEDCAKRGLLVPAQEVHHIIPVETRVDLDGMARLAYDPGNLAALCRECHHERHKQMRSHTKEETERRAKAAAADFWQRFGGEGG